MSFGPIAWNETSARPITTLPADCLGVRIRLRQEDYVRAFLRFADRVEQWLVAWEGENWSLSVRQAANVRVHIPA